MQALINDLLQYSRVGRSAREPALVSSDAALAQARNNLATGDGGDRSHGGDRAPALVLAELPLLTAVVPEPAQQRAEVQRRQAAAHRDHLHQGRAVSGYSRSATTASDRPEYAERIFVIFQRLNERSAYPGTGIGLRHDQEIIEYFGGRIWPDTSYADGSRFLFTLPCRPRR